MQGCGVLGLDLARRWGWAYIGAAGGYLASGHRELRASDDRGAQFHQLSLSIADLVTEYAPDFIAIETPIKRTSFMTARKLYGYAAVAEMIAHIHQVGFIEFSRTDYCLELLGRGNADKASGVAFCRQFKPGLTSDDEADSILIALTCAARRERREAA